MCRIVRNLAIKKYHSNTAAKRNSIYDVALEELEDCIPLATSVEDEIDAIAIAAMIDKFLETLERENRILFVRRYWYSDSIDDLAKLFGISNHGVSVKLFRTREKLRKYLIQEGVCI